MATHSSILACTIPWTEDPGGLQSMGLQRVRHDSECCAHALARAHTHTHTHTSLQYRHHKGRRLAHLIHNYIPTLSIPCVAQTVKNLSAMQKGHKESDTTEKLHFHFSLSCIGEGNGNTLQCSCLENPRDGGAWWAAVYGVTQSRTRLK